MLNAQMQTYNYEHTNMWLVSQTLTKHESVSSRNNFIIKINKKNLLHAPLIHVPIL